MKWEGHGEDESNPITKLQNNALYVAHWCACRRQLQAVPNFGIILKRNYLQRTCNYTMCKTDFKSLLN